MPIHPDVAARFHHLDGIRSLREAYADPAQRAQIQRYESWEPAQQPPTVANRADVAPGPHGPIPVRIYMPETASGAHRPCLVWAHGGGFVGGDLDMNEADWTAREVCSRAGAVVVSVDYRLAVKGVTYPAPLDDVVSSVIWTHDHARDLGVDTARISIGGASAGGNLAAGAVLRLRDRDGWLPAALVLVYPVLHPVSPPPSPSLAFALAAVPDVLRMWPTDLAILARNYIGGPPSAADGYAMPGLAALDGLCRTVVLNAEYDDLRASGEAFTASLALAGVDVRQVTVRGMLHGFLNLPGELQAVAMSLDLIADVAGAQPIGSSA